MCPFSAMLKSALPSPFTSLETIVRPFGYTYPDSVLGLRRSSNADEFDLFLA
jgi:hypothetical protein